MGCVVNGPGECEGSDVANIAAKGKGIIYVQGEWKAIVPNSPLPDASIAKCRYFA